MANPYLAGTVQIPSVVEITAITRAFPMVCTVSVDSVIASNTYVPGQLVRLSVPASYGMRQADGLIAKITASAATTITLDVDARGFDAFAVPASGRTPATMAAYGSRNLSLDNTTNQVPFQNLNNTGN